MHESEKRSFSRIDIGTHVQYRVAGREGFQEGMLDNASASGVLLWTQEADIVPGSQLLIIVEPEENSQQTPIEINATVVRNIGTNRDALIGYGCRIEQPLEED